MNWCAHDAVPHLLDDEALLKTQLVLTDDDPQLHGSFESALNRHKSKHGELGKHRSCKWHKVRAV